MLRIKRDKPSDLGPLADGNHVVIIGGGPGGASCALALQCQAAELGRRIHIHIVENKEFAGERQYNQCAGVLSPPLPALMEAKLGLPFPHHLGFRQIQGYVLHTGKEHIVLEEVDEPSIALRRVQFDAYMLEAVKQRRIDVVQARAVDLEFHDDRVIVYTENAPLEGDVIVGAWGMDEGSAALFSRVTGYQPPQSLSSIVTKFHPGEIAMSDFGSYIHAFLPRHPRIEFGAITPKGNHLTLNIAGKHIDSALMQSFIRSPAVQTVLPGMMEHDTRNTRDLRFFKGRFPCSLARHYYGDRFVTVGDAAGLVRAFKGKGVTSAVLTGIRAAEVILSHGISEYAFQQAYEKANDDIIGDFPYGRAMRFLTILIARLQLLDPVLRAARRSAPLRGALFGAVSGHTPYRQVLRQVLQPFSILSILQEMARL
jgi:flavin-dependent dehydrogenase